MNKAEEKKLRSYNEVAPLVQLAMKQLLSGGQSEAEKTCQLILEKAPTHPDALHFLGVINIQKGNLDKAVYLLTKAVQENPKYAAAFSSLATAYNYKRETNNALHYFQKSLELNTNDANTHNNLGQLYSNLGDVENAIACYKTAIKINPANSQAYSNIGSVYGYSGNIDEALDYFKKAAELSPNNPHIHSNFIFFMHYSNKFSNEEIFAETKKWAEKFAPLELAKTNHANALEENRKLKIGYVSSDFTVHPASLSIEQILKNHARDKFEIYCYSNVKKPDAVTQKLKSLPDHWVSIAGVNDEVAANKIIDAGIDILIDLSGHTSDHRLGVFARKPAPIQMTWIGYFDTTGMQQMDYIITDPHLILAGEEKLYSEKILYLPERIGTCAIPDCDNTLENSPHEKNGFITFGCFNNLAKISEETIKAWTEILKLVENSHLFLKSPAVSSKNDRGFIEEKFANTSIDLNRISFEARSAKKEYYESYKKVDIALDPFPYNGATTTIDALWMNVPVITVSGKNYVSRVGASIIGGSGFPELVTNNIDEYISLAVNLAEDKSLLKVIRAKINQNFKAAPIFNGIKLTKDLEKLFTDVWKAYISKKLIKD